MSQQQERWWWDLAAGRAVRDDERGPDKDVLGPYASRAEAEGWRERHQAREELWEDQDEEWEGRDAEGEGGAPTP